jgi:hypothetical protein
LAILQREFDTKMKKAFALPYAIMILVILGTLGIYSLQISSSTIAIVVDENIENQLNLYSKSAEELALLWLSKNNSSEVKISFEDGKYNFNIYTFPTANEYNRTIIMDITGYTEATGRRVRVTRKVIRKIQ